MTSKYDLCFDVLFVFYDENTNEIKEFIIGESNYSRLYVPPKVWFGFKNLSNADSLVVNIASIEHDDTEVHNRDIREIQYDWEKSK